MTRKLSHSFKFLAESLSRVSDVLRITRKGLEVATFWIDKFIDLILTGFVKALQLSRERLKKAVDWILSNSKKK